MNRKKWTAVLLTALMVFQVLVSAVFGEEASVLTLSGKLKIQGAVYVGSALSADFSKAEPAGLTSEDVSFQWTRQDGDTLLVLSEEKTYTPVQEDLNSSITLTVTGLAERGFGGSLTVKSNPVAQTAEEAAALAAQMPDEDSSSTDSMFPSAGTDPFAGTGSTGQIGQDNEGYQEYPGSGMTGDGQYTEGYTEYPAGDQNMQYSDGYEEYQAGDPNAQYTDGYDEYTDPNMQYTDPSMQYSDPNMQYTDQNMQYSDPSMQYTDPGMQYSDPNMQYTDPNTQYTDDYDEYSSAEDTSSEESTGFPETGDVPGMENANEQIYIYDPVTGQEVTPMPEAPEDAAGETQESAEDTQETAENAFQAEVTLEAEAEQIDFGTVTEEGLADSEPQYFTVTNTGTEPLNFEGIAPEHFMVGDITETLEPGTAVDLYIVPRAGVAPGEYRDEIVYRSVEGAEVSFTAAMKVEESTDLSSGESDSDYEEPDPDNTDDEDGFQIIQDDMDGEDGENGENDNSESDPAPGWEGDGTAEDDNPVGSIVPGTDPENDTTPAEPIVPGTEPAPTGENDTDGGDEGGNGGENEGDGTEAELILSLDVSPSTLDFGSLEEGYKESPEAQTVTITNTGSISVLLDQPISEYFYLPELTVNELAPGEALELMIWPLESLSANEYNESINILYQGGELPEGYDQDKTRIVDEGPYTIEAAFTVTKPSKEYKLTVNPGSYDFGTRTIAYQDPPEAATFTVTNEGNTAMTLNALSSSSYEVSGFSASDLEPGESAYFTVRPKVGLAAGDYPESLTLSTTDADGNVLLLAAVQVKFSVKAEEKIYRIVLDRSLIDFGSVEAGYVNPPAAQRVTITNTGNAAIALNQPSAINFRVSGLSSARLNPGETSSFTVVPLTGLGQGQYFEAITVTGDGGAAASVNVNFIVSARTIVLTGIINPADITGIRNGTEKTAVGLRLPGSVTITTNSGNMSAAVTWDVASCVYDPSLKTSQTFLVNGRVTLPGGVTNPNNIPLVATVRVTVNGRDPIVPDASGNQVIGIYNGDVYTTDDKISFSASGAGYGNVNPVRGDIRYVPYCWNVLDNRIWDCEPFSASFRMGAPGNYVLTVTFLQQQFNGSTWVNTGVSDVRKISFTVRQGRTVTMTPVPGQVRPARTGDDNNLLPLIIALAAAGAAIAAAVVVLIRRRRK